MYGCVSQSDDVMATSGSERAKSSMPRIVFALPSFG
jgi:hypothetical protein